MSRIKLIVGLANPGDEYANTRHNAGAWFVEALAQSKQASFHVEKKFQGQVVSVNFPAVDESVFLFIPTTYMNESGIAIRAISQFYKIHANEILVAHDELDFDPGVIRLKRDGGHGGHNGLRDTIAQLGQHHFMRLRIGIGHPGSSDQVVDYVLSRPSRHDKQLIDAAIDDAIHVIDDIVAGHLNKAMQKMHSEQEK